MTNDLDVLTDRKPFKKSVFEVLGCLWDAKLEYFASTLFLIAHQYWILKVMDREDPFKNPYRILRFSKNFRKIFKNFRNTFFENFFSSRKKILGIFLNTYVDPKFPKDSKNHT